MECKLKVRRFIRMSCKSLQLQQQLTYARQIWLMNFEHYWADWFIYFVLHLGKHNWYWGTQVTVNELLKLPLRSNEIIRSIDGLYGLYTYNRNLHYWLKNLIDAMLYGDHESRWKHQALYEIWPNASYLAQLNPYWWWKVARFILCV